MLLKQAKKAEIPIAPAEIFMSLVVPAYNEEQRLGEMLEEALSFLQKAYGTNAPRAKQSQIPSNPHGFTAPAALPGWEILVVNDGSTDKTVDIALDFARDNKVPADSIRVISLQENRGKGGAVTHGMRHVRGQYAVFADADGASKFEDLADLVEVCQRIEDPSGRAVAIGSRAHLVGSEAVVKVCPLSHPLLHEFPKD